MLPRLRKFQKRNEPPPTLFYALAGLFVFAMLLFLANSNWKLYKKRTELEGQINALQNEVTSLEERNRELKSGIVETQTPEYIERTARERLNLKKPGEKVVAVVIPESQKTASQEQKKRWWENWWEKLLEKIGL